MLKALGTYDAATGVETPRITVTLATAIPRSAAGSSISGTPTSARSIPSEWEGREAEGVLLVPNAGEVLYRAADLAR